MKYTHFAHSMSKRIQALPVVAALLLAGCSSSSSNTGTAATAAQGSEPKKPGKTTAVVASAAAPRSVFNIDQNSRDPFFPKAKKAVAVADAQQPQAAVDVISLLQAGFSGTIGSGEQWMALINNVMLEPGRKTEIPISAAGQSRLVSVRCREVARDSVVLEVQGHSQPVRLVRTAYN